MVGGASNNSTGPNGSTGPNSFIVFHLISLAALASAITHRAWRYRSVAVEVPKIHAHAHALPLLLPLLLLLRLPLLLPILMLRLETSPTF